MNIRSVVVLGGTGFVGHEIVARLAARGIDVTVVTRNAERHRDLQVLPTVVLVDVDVHDARGLRALLDGKDAVINLVGILNERGSDGSGFARVHVELPRMLVELCRAASVRRLLHMSALGASADGPSHYLRSKGLGEEAVMAAHGPDLAVTVFRPSVIFGPHDSFTHRFARLLRRSPVVFPLAMAASRMQPVYVNDVADAFVQALDDRGTFGQRYELCGPRAYALGEIVSLVARAAGCRRAILPLGLRWSHLLAAVLEFAPGKPLTRDNVRSLTRDSICRAGFPGVFGIRPTGMEAVMHRWVHPRP